MGQYLRRHVSFGAARGSVPTVGVEGRGVGRENSPFFSLCFHAPGITVTLDRS